MVDEISIEDVDERELSYYLDDSGDDLRNSVERSLARLAAREALVLRTYFGIGGGTGFTLARIGKILGVSGERVRQVKAKALRHLRQPCRTYPLKEFVRPTPAIGLPRVAPPAIKRRVVRVPLGAPNPLTLPPWLRDDPWMLHLIEQAERRYGIRYRHDSQQKGSP